MKTEKIFNSISNHPFIFLISIVLITSCCIGGLVTSARITSLSPTQISITNTETNQNHPTETLTLIPTNIQSLELTATNSTTLLSSIVTNTPSPDKTSTITLTTPSSTQTLAPTLTTASLVVHFIDVGQGDSILIVSPEGKTVLIDGGSTNTGVVDYLQRQGINHIDIMIATHPHEDHIGGLVQVLEAMPVMKVITNGQMQTTSTYEHFLDAIANANADYAEAKRGDTIVIGSLTFSVLSPVNNTGDDINNNSLVLRSVYGQTALLFMGDAGMDAEASILASGLPVQANILKVGHHGSRYSSSQVFIDAVNPEVAIYSAGVNNQYHHPSPETINTLNERGILILGTDKYGTIIVTTTTDGYTITDTNGDILRK